LDPALTIAATLNAKSPFVAPFGFEHEADRIKLTFKTGAFDEKHLVAEDLH
jgi:ATP-dependent RNA helicase DHX29